MMPEKILPSEQLLTLLTAGPPRIAAAATGLTSAQLRTRPAPDEWSANEVLAHLRACSDVWGDCIRTILAEERPTIIAVNPMTWLRKTDYLDLAFRTSFNAFTAQRDELVALLASLPPEAWERGALVKGAGSPLHRTVRSYAQRLAIHERPHLKQIERIAATVHA